MWSVYETSKQFAQHSKPHPKKKIQSSSLSIDIQQLYPKVFSKWAVQESERVNYLTCPLPVPLLTPAQL